MKTFLIILAALTISLSSCGKKYCNEIKDEWEAWAADYEVLLQEKAASLLHVEQMYGYGSEQYNAMLERYQECVAYGIRKNAEFEDEYNEANCPDKLD